MKSHSFDPLSYGMRSGRTAETKDLIIHQASDGSISVIEKSTGQAIVRLEFCRAFSREILEFIASDCQCCYTGTAG